MENLSLLGPAGPEFRGSGVEGLGNTPVLSETPPHPDRTTAAEEKLPVRLNLHQSTQPLIRFKDVVPA